MGDLFGGFKNQPVEQRLNSAETLMAYEESYMKLIKRYKDEIAYIEGMMKELRYERREFYTKQLPMIREELENDDVSPENRQKWLEEMQSNMEHSFGISEQLIDHYVTKNLDEFKHELQRAIK